MSGAFPNDKWPVDVVEAHDPSKDVVAHYVDRTRALEGIIETFLEQEALFRSRTGWATTALERGGLNSYGDDVALTEVQVELINKIAGS